MTDPVPPSPPSFEEAFAALRVRIQAEGGEFVTLERGLRNKARFGPMGVFVRAVDQDRETGLTRRDLELAWRRFGERGLLRREDIPELKDRGLVFALFALVPGVRPEPFGQGIRWVGPDSPDAVA